MLLLTDRRATRVCLPLSRSVLVKVRCRPSNPRACSNVSMTSFSVAVRPAISSKCRTNCDFLFSVLSKVWVVGAMVLPTVKTRVP